MYICIKCTPASSDEETERKLILEFSLFSSKKASLLIKLKATGFIIFQNTTPP